MAASSSGCVVGVEQRVDVDGQSPQEVRFGLRTRAERAVDIRFRRGRTNAANNS